MQRFKVQAEFLWVEFLVSVCLRAMCILFVMYAYHMTSKSVMLTYMHKLCIPTLPLNKLDPL